MKCLNCKKEFEPTRTDARFDSAKCRKSFNRDNKRDIPPSDVTDNVTDNSPEFIPNWKRNGFKSKDEGLAKAMADLASNPTLEEQIFYVKNKSFQIKKRRMVRIA